MEHEEKNWMQWYKTQYNQLNQQAAMLDQRTKRLDERESLLYEREKKMWGWSDDLTNREQSLGKIVREKLEKFNSGGSGFRGRYNNNRGDGRGSANGRNYNNNHNGDGGRGRGENYNNNNYGPARNNQSRNYPYNYNPNNNNGNQSATPGEQLWTLENTLSYINNEVELQKAKSEKEREEYDPANPSYSPKSVQQSSYCPVSPTYHNPHSPIASPQQPKTPEYEYEPTD